MFNRKPTLKEKRKVEHTLITVAFYITGHIRADNSNYSLLLNKLDFEIEDPLIDSVLDKLVLKKNKRQVEYTLEEELCIYTYIHIATAYTYVDDFFKLLNDFLYDNGEEEGIPDRKEYRKRTCDGYYQHFSDLLSEMEIKLTNEPEFIERKKELNKYIRLDKLYAIDF